MFKKAMLTTAIAFTALFMSSHTLHAVELSENQKLTSGLQLYKADRLFEVLSRLDFSVARVIKSSESTTSIYYGNQHENIVDDKLLELVSRHSRELPDLSVVYFSNDTEYAKTMKSAKKLISLGAKVSFLEGNIPCEENIIVDDQVSCHIFLIQFHATQKGN